MTLNVPLVGGDVGSVADSDRCRALFFCWGVQNCTGRAIYLRHNSLIAGLFEIEAEGLACSRWVSAECGVENTKRSLNESHDAKPATSMLLKRDLFSGPEQSKCRAPQRCSRKHLARDADRCCGWTKGRSAKFIADTNSVSGEPYGRR
jgi:hypothetical protein